MSHFSASLPPGLYRVTHSFGFCAHFHEKCRLLKTVRLSWRKQQGPWGSRAELDEVSHQYAKRLAYSELDNGIFIGGDEQCSHWGQFGYRELLYGKSVF